MSDTGMFCRLAPPSPIPGSRRLAVRIHGPQARLLRSSRRSRYVPGRQTQAATCRSVARQLFRRRVRQMAEKTPYSGNRLSCFSEAHRVLDSGRITVGPSSPSARSSQRSGAGGVGRPETVMRWHHSLRHLLSPEQCNAQQGLAGWQPARFTICTLSGRQGGPAWAVPSCPRSSGSSEPWAMVRHHTD